MGELLSIDARIAAPPGRVYEALTDAGTLRTWLAEHAEVSLPERRFEFWGRHTPQGERGRQRLLSAEDGRALRFGWRLDGEETTATFTLAADGDGTRVTLEQTGVPTVEEMMSHTGARDGLHTLHTFWSLAVGNLTEYAEGRELTPKADFSPDRPLEIRAEVTVDDSPEAVFRSLTDPDTVRRWFGWPVEIEPRVGGKVTLGADGEVTEFEPGRVFVYVDGEMVTRWELEGSGGRTRLTFVQSGFTEAERDSAAQHEAGWLQGIAALKLLHSTGGEPPEVTLPGAHRVEVSTRIDAPAAVVWTALTRPEHVAVWYAFDGAEIDLRPGGAMVFRWAEHGDFHSVFERVEPGRLLEFRTSRVPGAVPEPGDETLVRITLAERDGGTDVRLTESGIDGLTGTDAERAQHAEDARGGWTVGLAELKTLAEKLTT